MTLDAIITTAANTANTSAKELRGPNRNRRLCMVRDWVCATARQQGYSGTAIGAALGGRNHTTIYAAERRHAERTSK